ncbi:hypothetical protein [Parasitella parasitica]|uniref:Reticulon-like protein n=1 Tax=Parasitella parasitica TaxID=35722 RepID=A0A0B7NQ51_9FUNG|nr:hypothetical protein [Parasitella parasitica]
MAQVAQQQNNHIFDLNSKSIASPGPRKNVAPPSPQLSQDDLGSGLGVLGKHDISPTTSTGLLSPAVCGSPKPAEEMDLAEDEAQEDLNDVALLMYMEFMDLIYWEIPGRSGIILAGILASLVLTSYYSLLYVFAGTLTILTGFNLIFVNAYNGIRTVWTGLAAEEFPHPYHLHIRPQRSSLLPRDAMDYYIHKSVDILELVAQQIAKIVFVQDTKTTSLACLASGVIYLMTSLIPTKVFFGLLVVALFTAPYYYDKHQDLVDEQLLLLQEKSLVWKDKYGAVARNQAALYTKQILTFSAGLGNTLQQEIKKYSKRATDSNVSTTTSPTMTSMSTAENPVDTKTEKL